jgi:hypothetical protein
VRDFESRFLLSNCGTQSFAFRNFSCTAAVPCPLQPPKRRSKRRTPKAARCGGATLQKPSECGTLSPAFCFQTAELRVPPSATSVAPLLCLALCNTKAALKAPHSKSARCCRPQHQSGAQSAALQERPPPRGHTPKAFGVRDFESRFLLSNCGTQSSAFCNFSCTAAGRNTKAALKAPHSKSGPLWRAWGFGAKQTSELGFMITEVDFQPWPGAPWRRNKAKSSLFACLT